MTEVKDVERHLRFKKYLAKDDVFSPLPIRTKKTPSKQQSIESGCGDVTQPTPEIISKHPSNINIVESPKPSVRPSKPGGNSTESTPRDVACSSQSATPSSLNGTHPIGWGNLPMTLPPPFSREKRTVSDALSLPSRGSHRLPLRNDMYHEPPITPPRRSSLRLAHTDVRPGSSSLGRNRRLVSSVVRFASAIAHSPHHGSTPSSPSPRVAGLTSGLTADEDWVEPTTRPDDMLRVYNDALPASSQPQTPYNLPEARHRSRLNGSSTAPLPRRISRPVYHARQPSAEQEGRDGTNFPSNHQARGFRGLYDGQENADESTLFYEATEYQHEASTGHD
ncbi:hypothetical protein M426DRAFT_11473 [Hypoxylon sp. CI-4A]|nr:hypothetical protein M426DRAFT_11473 [Hypoxylon sp. CI-4A]